MMTYRKTWLAAVCFIMTLGFHSPVFAHNLWINPSNHFPAVGDTVDIVIAWGHTYNANRLDQDMKAGNLAYIRVMGPDGSPAVPVTVDETHYKLKIEKAGAYLVTAGIKPGVFTKTTEGRKWCDKKGVEHPLSCTSFSIDAKTVIIAGSSDQNLTGVTGQDLEVIPLSDPRTVKPGDAFNVKILFKNKPAADVTVNAAYAGFAQEDQAMDVAPHHPEKGPKAQGHHFPVSAVTDLSGKASLVLGKPGYWMVIISHKTPYPDTTICDEYMNNMAFTFEVK